MTLALLLTAATGAWAESKPIGLNVEYAAGDKITSTTDVYVYHDEGQVIKITSTTPASIRRIAGIEVSFNEGSEYEVIYQNPDDDPGGTTIAQFIKCVGESTGDATVVHVASGSGTLADPYVFAPGPGSSGNAFPITWSATTPNTASIEAMPAGNVTVNVKYYPQATAEGAVTAATGVLATTDDPLVTVDKTKLTGAAKMMYYVSKESTAPAYGAKGWTDKLPTAKDYTEAANLNVWYYPVGTDNGVDGATATYSDGDMNATALPVTLGDAPTYDVTLNADGLSTDEAAAWQVAKGTADPAAFPLEGVKRGETVTVTYSGTKKIIGVKAEKAAASTPLDNTTTAWTAGTFAVPAGGLTYSDAITVSGDVTLVLTDDETLTLNQGISIADGATLTIQGNGTMNVNGTNNSTASTVAGSGTLVLTSGTLTAKGGNGGGYGDREAVSGSKQAGGVAINGAVTVSGGTLTATGGAGGSIGDSNADVTAGAGGAAISGSVTLVSGTLTATGGNGGNGGQVSTGTAGAGGAAIGGDLTVNGGTMTTTNGSNGVATGSPTAVNLGAGGKAVAGTVTDNRS